IKIISIINKAIEEKKQLQIDSYRSSNSSTVLNRLVEPFSFINDYSATWCYDLDDNKCKLFKLARMGSVHITSNRWANEDSHKIS
ncbi:WYL domain-containing protein, partial [Shewanella algae]|uniref:WYL domain-containing protein n=1 Tax=Shewanella algae TaxID=38313 RepID=UPI00313BFFEE